jgi:hypothetical protein
MTILQVLLSITFLALLCRDVARAQDNFFAGKTVRIVVGSMRA